MNAHQMLNLNKMLELVRPLLEGKLVSVKIGLKDDQYVLVLDGFYKHGNVTLSVSNQTSAECFVVSVQGRYGSLGEIYNPDFKDLVSINYCEFLAYQDRGFDVDPSWAPYLVEHGYLTIEVKTSYKPAR